MTKHFRLIIKDVVIFRRNSISTNKFNFPCVTGSSQTSMLKVCIATSTKFFAFQHETIDASGGSRIFPGGGAPAPKSAIIFQFICQKLHENERIWTLGARIKERRWNSNAGEIGTTSVCFALSRCLNIVLIGYIFELIRSTWAPTCQSLQSLITALSIIGSLTQVSANQNNSCFNRHNILQVIVANWTQFPLWRNLQACGAYGPGNMIQICSRNLLESANQICCHSKQVTLIKEFRHGRNSLL